MSRSLLNALRSRRTLPRPAVSVLILLNLIWLVLLLTGTDAGPAAWACGIALAAAFLAVPWVSDIGEEEEEETPDRAAHLWVAGVTVMAVGLVLTDGENATVMLSYPAIVSVWICRPARARAVWSALLALLGTGLWYVEGADPGTAAALFGAAVAVAMNHILRAAVARAREARIAQRELVSASRGMERNRLLREVHDIVGQELTLIAMEAERAQAQPRPASAGDGPSGIESVGARARTLLSRMESELMSLRGTSFAEECRRAEEACAAAGLSLTVRFEVPGGPLAPQADQVLGCVLREAMTNVFRHAPGARSFRFSVGEDPRGIAFTAVDDGGPVPPPRPGMGLTGLRDRLAEIGGELEADLTPDGRFALAGYIPRTVPTGSPEEAP